jgi:hypothetical protein
LVPIALAGLALSGGGPAGRDGCELRQNDPNPFCDSTGVTLIRFTLPEAAPVRLEILSPDSSQVVRTLADVNLPAGTHTAQWDGRDEAGLWLAEGVYPYRLIVPGCERWRQATIRCGTPARELTWGALKALLRAAP